MNPRQPELAGRPIAPIVIQEPRVVTGTHGDLQVLLRLVSITFGNLQEQIIGLDNESLWPVVNLCINEKIWPDDGSLIEYLSEVEPFFKQTHYTLRELTRIACGIQSRQPILRLA